MLYRENFGVDFIFLLITAHFFVKSDVHGDVPSRSKLPYCTAP